MALFKSSNPALRAETFTRFGAPKEDSGAMTLNGTVNKIAILLALVVGAGSLTWTMTMTAFDPAAVMPWILTGAIGGFILAIVTSFKQTWAPYTAPLYAVFKGLFLGGISAWYEMGVPGIVSQALMLTFGTLICLLLAYRSGLVKPTENFKLGIMAATGGIALVYLATIVMRLFGMDVPLIHESGPIGIGFSLFVVVIAALNLVLDFDFIEQGAETKAPKYMEWYAAFGLMVTLIWLYVEFLRLLSKLSRD